MSDVKAFHPGKFFAAASLYLMEGIDQGQSAVMGGRSDMGRARLRFLALFSAAVTIVSPGIARSVAAAPPPADTRDLTAYVNALSGTLGPGFPMVGGHLPFGMIEPGPDTGHPGTADPLNYDGYAYQDTLIRGFSLSHFDGAGIPIGGDLPFMPTTGAVSSSDPVQYQSAYTHAAETAQPGFYSVNLVNGASVAITAAQRAALIRFTFPAGQQANVLANAGRSIRGTHPASVSVVGDRTLEGWMRSETKPGDGYKLYFSAVFDHPFTATGTWLGSAITPGSRSATGDGAGAYLSFAPGQVVTMRVGISYVDLAGAENNLQQEIPATASFDAVRQAAHDTWNRHLHQLEVEGGAPDQIQTFYSNLYRALSLPSLFDDVDGRYIGFDHLLHTVPAGQHHYTKLSLWDTYRTQNPLLELIEPKVQHDVLLSMLDDYDQNHQAIPKWTDANLDYLIMGGDGGAAEIADGVARGILRGPEAARAYAALLHQASTVAPPVPAREFLDSDVKYGYIPYDLADFRATAETQEYAITDAATYELARRLGTPKNVTMLRARADQWKHLLDPSGFIRPRNKDGSWANPTNLGTVSMGNLPPDGGPHTWTPMSQDGYQEATGWQQTFEEPQDVLGLANAIGGPAAMLSRLDTFFSADLADAPYAVPVTQQYTSFFGVYYIGNQFTPANEPDLWTPWYYNWLGQPYKTQKVVRAAMETYNSTALGLPGNDDTGTMSSWYVLAALGLYGTQPGMPVFELNSPTFAVTRVHLPGGVFTVEAPAASVANKYIQSAALNGQPFDRTYVTQCEIQPGGVLSYDLGAQANTAWGTAADSAPPALSDPSPRVPIETCGNQILGRAPSSASASTAASAAAGGPTTLPLTSAGGGPGPAPWWAPAMLVVLLLTGCVATLRRRAARRRASQG
ncbi:MAG: GH92 family glycosyl hydrolase [Candidatus Dormibacteria bacterium]